MHLRTRATKSRQKGKVTKAVRGVPAFGIAVLRLHRAVMLAPDRTWDHD